MNESLLQSHIKNFDLNHIRSPFEEYYRIAVKQDRNEWSKLLVQDFEFRYIHKLNVVASCEGTQGSGKSLFLEGIAIALGKIFNKPFKIDNVCFTPYEFERKLKKSKDRETFIVDEQTNITSGIMSRHVSENLKDYEEQLRYTQNNLLYASPSLRMHEHFFIFNTDKVPYSSVERIANKECSKAGKCICKKTGRKEFESCGYPLRINAMLLTINALDNYLRERAIISIPMLEYGFYKQYDKRKKEYLSYLKKKSKGGIMPEVFDAIETIIKTRKKDLFRKNAKGKIVLKNIKDLRIIAYEEVGANFTVKGLEDFVVPKLIEKTERLNITKE